MTDEHQASDGSESYSWLEASDDKEDKDNSSETVREETVREDPIVAEIAALRAAG